MTPEGNFDRNYFVYDLPDGVVVKSVEFDAAGSILLEDSAEPKAAVVTGNKIVTLFGAGVVRGPGFAPRFKIMLGAAQ